MPFLRFPFRLILVLLPASVACACLAACVPDRPAAHSNFGRASAHNFKAMLADRGDLNEPRAETARLASRRDAVMRAYIAGRDTSAARSTAETVKLSPAGGAQ